MGDSTGKPLDVRAAVLQAYGEPFSLETLILDPPRHDEVRVRMVAVGVCHTDAVVREGAVPGGLPFVLGHEGAGVVESVGAGVTKVAPGDHVVLTVNSCGVCEGCQGGHPALCDSSFPLNFNGCRPDGSHALHGPDGGEIHDRFFAQSSFATYAVGNERNVVKVDKDAPLELLGPLGCGIQTGAGSVLNGLDVRMGETIVIFGTGAVGLSAVMGARVAAATTIVAVDLHRHRLELARELGATHIIKADEEDVVARIRAITGGQGSHYALDTTGNHRVIRQAVDGLRPRGVCGIVGASDPGVPLELNAMDMMTTAKTLKGIVEGDSIPDFFIPRLIELYRDGRFPFDRLLRFYELEQIDQAFADSANGTTIKPVVRVAQPHPDM